MRIQAKENEQTISDLEKVAALLETKLREKRQLKEAKKKRKEVVLTTPGEHFERCTIFGDPF